jgi:hypothetical protein
VVKLLVPLPAQQTQMFSLLANSKTLLLVAAAAVVLLNALLDAAEKPLLETSADVFAEA